MDKAESFDTMTDLCIAAGQAVMTTGSTELRAAMRIVLGILGREVAQRTLFDEAAKRGVAAKPQTAKPLVTKVSVRSMKPAGSVAPRRARRGSLAPCA